jgi:hypothetical protein
MGKRPGQPVEARPELFLVLLVDDRSDDGLTRVHWVSWERSLRVAVAMVDRFIASMPPVRDLQAAGEVWHDEERLVYAAGGTQASLDDTVIFWPTAPGWYALDEASVEPGRRPVWHLAKPPA